MALTKQALKAFLIVLSIAIAGTSVAPAADAFSRRVDRFTSNIPTTRSSVNSRAPQNLKTGKITRYSVELKWSKPKKIYGNRATYYIYRVYQNQAYLVGETFGDLSFNVRGVEASGYHRFFVRASHQNLKTAYDSRAIDVSTSKYSGEISTRRITTDKTAPTKPGKLTAVADANAVLLTWKASRDSRRNDSGIAGYRIYRARNGQGRIIGEVKGTKTMYQIIGIERSPKHAFYVRAVDKAGNVSDATPIKYVSNYIASAQ